MKRWALTGPIGAGKSLASAHLVARGAALVSGDELGHELLRRPDIREAVGRTFGPEVVPGGDVDRGRLGALVFADAAALAHLNEITHGPLGDLAGARLDALAAAGGHALAVFEAAVYFLLPSPPPVDLVIAVTAGADVRAARLAAARGLEPATARARVEAQADWDVFWARADRVLVNDREPVHLRRALDELWRAEGLPGPDPSSQGDPRP